MTELPPITTLRPDIPVMKVKHVRGSLWIVAYIGGLIEMVDFNGQAGQEPLLSFQIPNAANLEHLQSQ